MKRNGQKQTIDECILKPSADCWGYLKIGLYAGGKPKYFFVHRLVAAAFITNPDDKPEINHRDEDKTNNCAANLEWCTRKENINHGTRSERMVKTLSKPVGQYTMNGELVKIWDSSTIAGKQGGFNRGHICAVANRKRKTHKGFIWRYVS